ncbi:hypothetical protein T310_5401, partial [Rasamsonia emersonii CBS 393.64]
LLFWSSIPFLLSVPVGPSFHGPYWTSFPRSLLDSSAYLINGPFLNHMTLCAQSSVLRVNVSSCVAVLDSALFCWFVTSLPFFKTFVLESI